MAKLKTLKKSLYCVNIDAKLSVDMFVYGVSVRDAETKAWERFKKRTKHKTQYSINATDIR